MNAGQSEEMSICFNLNDLIHVFPEQAETLVLDRYLVNHEEASARIFRVYSETPPHYHDGCDEHLYVFSGRGTFWMNEPKDSVEFAPGSFLFVRRKIVHALPKILESPVVFLSIDVPRRDPGDIIFVDPMDGSLTEFIRRYDE